VTAIPGSHNSSRGRACAWFGAALPEEPGLECAEPVQRDRKHRDPSTTRPENLQDAEPSPTPAAQAPATTCLPNIPLQRRPPNPLLGCQHPPAPPRLPWPTAWTSHQVNDPADALHLNPRNRFFAGKGSALLPGYSAEKRDPGGPWRQPREARANTLALETAELAKPAQGPLPKEPGKAYGTAWRFSEDRSLPPDAVIDCLVFPCQLRQIRVTKDLTMPGSHPKELRNRAAAAPMAQCGRPVYLELRCANLPNRGRGFGILESIRAALALKANNRNNFGFFPG